MMKNATFNFQKTRRNRKQDGEENKYKTIHQENGTLVLNILSNFITLETSLRLLSLLSVILQRMSSSPNLNSCLYLLVPEFYHPSIAHVLLWQQLAQRRCPVQACGIKLLAPSTPPHSHDHGSFHSPLFPVGAFSASFHSH